MTMKKTWEVELPYPVDVVIRAFVDKAFHLDKVKALGAQSVDLLAHDFDGEQFMIRMQRNLPIEVDIPRALKDKVSSSLLITHEDHWQSSALQGSATVEFTGLPIEAECQLSLSEQGAATCYRYDWQVTSSVPLFGKQIEKLVLKDLDNKIQQETEVSLPLISRYA